MVMKIIKERKPVERTVRNALLDGQTKFLRPLPGEARMYPETDLPLIKISEQRVENLQKNLPKLKADILEELTKHISEEYAKMLIKENKIDRFNELGKSELAAKLLILYPKEVSSHEKIDIEKIEPLLGNETLKKIISAVKNDRIAESSIKSVIIELIKGKDLEKIFQSLKPANKSDIEKEVKQVIKEKPGLTAGAYMGLLMGKLKGRVEGKELIQLIQKALK